MAHILDGRSILITGGASGIGRAVALRCADAGAAITITDVNVEAGTGVADEIVRNGGEAQFVRLDVTDEAQHHAAADAAMKAFGKLDGSCNAAGKPFQGRPMHEIDPDFWESVYALNLRSVFYATRAQVPAMLDAGRGSIVNVASTAGIAAFPGGADYCAAKGGIMSATRAAALDYAKLGIRVNSVLPGATRTPMMQGQMDAFDGLEDMMMAANPMGRLAEPDEIAYAVRWLLSDEASFVTGTMLIVDGGLTAA
ncbi:glucose 1-dehydrogenase [Sinorhizobium meliloti]|uniref:SDR family NAD(P)-dependent oxidoreductase n=1 Tax=Rhizobium meliloti TaxID=382 RepID=UPI0012960546|nr:SDR family NAD(P)-dependent oxidoreductase [Sinorhizobium meliloti]MDW9486216.1 glucose 1-dehydrogenase [Sinorhizobium meliloti]MDW9605107.1 glucose 1-dehydrogenase [Sinorhizobium meliloti]MDW9675206.1 glucose 1-dehydrogenase [Sinorhizobium meliloti]MDW9951857.1 glucose 1-dehydrogenase [Sinorhizobium meliloti]MDX0386804.1 glucose 1-dehydrogenase [Sinorhizobium meliloti]